MNYIIRFWNQNRKKIILGTGVLPAITLLSKYTGYTGSVMAIVLFISNNYLPPPIF